MNRIVIDKYIPYLDGVFEPFAEVFRLTPEEITAATVRNADILIVRTRTRCNAALLDGSRVRFIATATIGFDHIDTIYCKEHGIRWIACPGCNAQAVCDYVEEALRSCEQVCGKAYRSIGIVGVGHVGSLVARMAAQRGLQVVLCDPLRNDAGFVSAPMEAVAECDVVTFHTPLTYAGESACPTYHLCDATFLSRCKKDALIINAARGGVVDEKALIESGNPCVIDCWEGEPHICTDLLRSEKTLLASFHIAGYSVQGKRNASQTCAEAVCDWLEVGVKPALPSFLQAKGDSEAGWLIRVTEQLRQSPCAFETLRRNYIPR